MKKTLAFLCIVVIVATTLLPLIALADTRYVYTKDGKSLNLRSTPKSNTGNKIGNIPYGTKIIVREYLDDGWAYVKYGKRFRCPRRPGLLAGNAGKAPSGGSLQKPG